MLTDTDTVSRPARALPSSPTQAAGQPQTPSPQPSRTTAKIHNTHCALRVHSAAVLPATHLSSMTPLRNPSRPLRALEHPPHASTYLPQQYAAAIVLPATDLGRSGRARRLTQLTAGDDDAVPYRTLTQVLPPTSSARCILSARTRPLDSPRQAPYPSSALTSPAGRDVDLIPICTHAQLCWRPQALPSISFGRPYPRPIIYAICSRTDTLRAQARSARPRPPRPPALIPPSTVDVVSSTRGCRPSYVFPPSQAKPAP
ncbi:hypothetical protein C8R46DRAFT_1231926 [Mycena filopes]|nr:hypothetical protein C8R46DRAFT_1231926 [Mycena filopes]